MNKKILIRIILTTIMFATLFFVYWIMSSFVYSFFIFRDVSFSDWMQALKIKSNVSISFLLTGASFICYLLYLCYLNLNLKLTNSLKIKIMSDKKKKLKELKKIHNKDLVLLDKKIGLIKSKLNQHTLLIGTTGSGKTTTALSLINQLANKLGQTVIIIDGKGDIDLINKIKKIDSRAFVWSIGSKQKYNPLASKNHIVLADKIMSLFDFTEPHYEATAHDYLLIASKTMKEKNIPITLSNILKYFSVEKLIKVVDKSDDKFDDLIKFDKKNISSLKSRLSIYDQQLENSIGIQNDLDILVKNHKIILFSLDSMSYPKLASSIGKLIIQDLKEFATTKDREKRINIFLDEFNVFASQHVINLINKGRGFNYQCFLSFQTIKDLEINNQNLSNIIFGNVSNIIAHNIQDPVSAEYVAKVFGTQTNEKLTKQVDRENKTGKGSIREVEEYKAHPNELKTLKLGEAYVKILLPSSKQLIDKVTIEPFNNYK